MAENKKLELEKEVAKLKMDVYAYEHKLKMERILAERENAKQFHEMALERERIKSAEIRKSQERKLWTERGGR